MGVGGEGCFGDAESYAGGASDDEDVLVGEPLVFWGCHFKIVGVGNVSCMILWYEIRIRERMDKYYISVICCYGFAMSGTTNSRTHKLRVSPQKGPAMRYRENRTYMSTRLVPFFRGLKG